MLDDATVAARLERPGSPWRPLALAALGIAHVLGGEQERAVKEFSLAVDFGRKGQSPAAALSYAELALLALEHGDPAADAEASASLALIEGVGLRQNVVAILTSSKLR